MVLLTRNTDGKRMVGVWFSTCAQLSESLLRRACAARKRLCYSPPLA